MIRTVYRRKGKPHTGYLPYQAQPTHFPNFRNRLPYPPTLLRVRRLGEWYPQQVSSQPYLGHLHIPILPFKQPYLSTLPFPILPREIPCPINLCQYRLNFEIELCNSKHIFTRNSNFVTRNSNFVTRNSKILTRNSKILTRNSNFVTRNSKFLTRNSKPLTRNSKFLTRNSKLLTRNSKGRVNHTQVTYPTKPNLPTSQIFPIGYPIRLLYLGYAGWESGTLNRYLPNPILVTFISLSFPLSNLT